MIRPYNKYQVLIVADHQVLITRGYDEDQDKYTLDIEVPLTLMEEKQEVADVSATAEFKFNEEEKRDNAFFKILEKDPTTMENLEQTVLGTIDTVKKTID